MTGVPGQPENDYYHCGERTSELACPICGEWIVRIGE